MEGRDSLSKSFGLSIAFLIPGAIGLYAASFSMPVIERWFGADAEITVGGFLFVVLGSSGMGVFISGIRWLVLEDLTRFTPSPPSNIDVARRKDERCEAAYQDLLFRHYQFYQFYANTPFALAIVYVAWLMSGRADVTPWRAVSLVLVMSVVDVVLLRSARHAITRYSKKLTDLLGLRSTESIDLANTTPTKSAGPWNPRDNRVPYRSTVPTSASLDESQ